MASAPLGQGMQAYLSPDEDGFGLILALRINKPTAKEMKQLRGPLRIGVTDAQPLTWITLNASGLTYDAPYARGITSPGHSDAVARSATMLTDWKPGTRGLVQVVAVDRGKIIIQRVLSLSQDWWVLLGASVSASPATMAISQYNRTIDVHQARWTTAALTANAQITEIGGAV